MNVRKVAALVPALTVSAVVAAALGAVAGTELRSGTAPAAQPGVTLVTTDAPVPDDAGDPAAVPTPTADELTTVLLSAVDPQYPPEQRQAHVERGAEAADTLDRISSRAGKMMRVVHPKVVDPITVTGDEATGPLQVALGGGTKQRSTPLQLTFKYVDNQWVVSARSVCDVASFNGFECPAGYAD